MSEFPTDFLKLYYRCFKHFIHSNCFAGFCPSTVWFGVTRPWQRRRRSYNGWQVCSQDVTLHWWGSSESHATTVHRDIFFENYALMGDLSSSRMQGFCLEQIELSMVESLPWKKHLWFSSLQLYQFILDDLVLCSPGLHIFFLGSLLIPITPTCGIVSWFPRWWSGEYVDLFQSLGCSILPSLGVGICSITAMAKTFVASFVSWFLPKIIGDHIFFCCCFFLLFCLVKKHQTDQIRGLEGYQGGGDVTVDFSHTKAQPEHLRLGREISENLFEASEAVLDLEGQQLLGSIENRRLRETRMINYQCALIRPSQALVSFEGGGFSLGGSLRFPLVDLCFFS